MKLTPRVAGGLSALGGLVFLLTAFGPRRLQGLTDEVVRLDVPSVLFDCCGCFGIGTFALPLALLAITLLRSPPEA